MERKQPRLPDDDDIATSKLNGYTPEEVSGASDTGYDASRHSDFHIDPMPGPEPISFIHHWRLTNKTEQKPPTC